MQIIKKTKFVWAIFGWSKGKIGSGGHDLDDRKIKRKDKTFVLLFGNERMR